MLKKAFGLSCLFLLLTLSSIAQTKLLNISPQFASPVAATPRVVWDASRENWVIVWRQGNFIKARVLNIDFTMSAPRNLASGVVATEGSFDLGIDTRDDAEHLLAFENPAGLQVRTVPRLVPGTIRLMEAGAKGSSPRLVFDAGGSRYFLFWLGTQDGTRSALRVRVLNQEGEPLASAVTLASAAPGQTFASLNVGLRSNGAMTAIVFQKSNTGGSLIKVNVSPSGTLQGGKQNFQNATAALNTVGDIDFSQAIGFALWIDKAAVKRRKVTVAGSFGGGTVAIPNAAAPDASTIQAGVAFNAATKQFVGVWTNVNKILSVNLNGISGVPVKPPQTIATSLQGFARNANVASSDMAQSLVVWEDANAQAGTTGPKRLQIRAAILSASGGGGGGTASVSIGDNFFNPQSITVAVGTTVTWTNNGRVTHTVTQTQVSPPLFDSGSMNSGATFSFKFTQAGTFSYFCKIHGTSMSGTVIVQ